MAHDESKMRDSPLPLLPSPPKWSVAKQVILHVKSGVKVHGDLRAASFGLYQLTLRVAGLAAVYINSA